jgi:tetratricopeptide (TPR) repeat protein
LQFPNDPLLAAMGANMAVIPVAITARPASTGAYRNLFDGYVLRRVQVVHSRVEQALEQGEKVPEETLKAALHSLEYAFKLPAIWPHTRDLLLLVAQPMALAGYRDAWTPYLERGIALGRQQGDVAAEINLSLALARLRFQQSRSRQMVSAYRQVIRLAQQQNDRYNLARALTNLGFHYVENGHWWRAEVMCCRALEIFEALKSEHGLAHTHNHLGILWLWQERWTEAERHLRQAVELWRGMGDNANLASGLNNLGVIYNDTLQPEQALPYFEEAIAYSERLGNETEAALAGMNIGIAYRRLQTYSMAEEQFWQAYTVFDRLGNRFYLALVIENLGRLATDCQRWTEAESYLTDALTAWRHLGNRYHEVLVTICLGDNAARWGRLDQAEQWITKAQSLLVLQDPARRYHHLWRWLRELNEMT